MAALKPILSEEQYRATDSLVKEFGKKGGEGEALNKLLINKNHKNKHTSYITGTDSMLILKTCCIYCG